jgi:light-regulated signal transduction histidine kinase (bacteriophytochrome)
MQSLVRDLLMLSRAGRAAMNRAETPLDACVDAALEQLDVQIAETNADISREALPRAIVDHTLITQLFQNLIGNAIKFHAPGQRPEVRVTCERRGEQFVIGVSDRGIGIKPEYAEQIFTPFKRLHGRDEYEGTGIGLAICRKAVSRHGGRIWVESTPGAGSHFRFTLGSETRMDACREAA